MITPGGEISMPMSGEIWVPVDREAELELLSCSSAAYRDGARSLLLAMESSNFTSWMWAMGMAGF